MAGRLTTEIIHNADGSIGIYDRNGVEFARFDGANKKIDVLSGGELELSSGSTFDTAALKQGVGVINLHIFNARLLTTNAFLTTIEGGTPDGNTAPSLARVNGATDKMARLAWAAAAVDEIQLPNITYPPDLDDTQDLTVCVLAAMAGATNTPTITVGYFEGVGDADAGGATGAVTGTTVAKYTRTITAANIGAYPNVAAITLTPGAHGTDALYVYGAWIEYVRKQG